MCRKMLLNEKRKTPSMRDGRLNSGADSRVSAAMPTYPRYCKRGYLSC